MKTLIVSGRLSEDQELVPIRLLRKGLQLSRQEPPMQACSACNFKV